MPIHRIGDWESGRGTPLEQVRGFMQENHAELVKLATGGCTDERTAKKRVDEIMEEQHELAEMQRKLMDFSGTLATMDAGEGGMGGGGDHVRLKAFRGPDAQQRAYAAGQWCRWRLLHDEGAQAWCQNHPEMFAAAGESINTAGGFLVPEILGRTIIDLREQYGVARRECDIVTMESDTKVIPRREGGVVAYYTGENIEIAASDVQWGLISLGAKKLAAMSRLSTEVADDAVIDLAEHVAQEIAWAFSQAEDDALFNGDGSLPFGGIRGILPKIVDGTHTAGAIVTVTAAHDTFAELDITDLGGLIAALPEFAEANAKWFCSGRAWGLVFARLLMAASGNSQVDLSAGLKRAYMGYPIVTSPKMPSGAATDYTGLPMILFGDMRKAVTFGNRRDTRLKVDASRFLEWDQVAVLGTERYDINVHDLGDNTAAGPLVALVGGAG